MTTVRFENFATEIDKAAQKPVNRRNVYSHLCLQIPRGWVTHETDKDNGKKRYAYDPHGLSYQRYFYTCQLAMGILIEKIIAAKLRQCGLTVEVHDDHFPQNSPDEDWLLE